MGDGVSKASEGDKAAMTTFFESVFDDEGIQLQIDILLAAFGGTEDDLNVRFNMESLNKLYAFILKRNFQIQDLIESFMSRFSDAFGVSAEGQAPPPASPPAS